MQNRRLDWKSTILADNGRKLSTSLRPGLGRTHNIKVVIIGNGAVGKTSMLYAHHDNTFPLEYIGVMDNPMFVIDVTPNITVNMTVWDTGEPALSHTQNTLTLFRSAGQEEYERHVLCLFFIF